jgi:SAM-dependent MidA family methyltransferase
MAGAEARDRIGLEVERLAGPDQMGELFKALCIASPNHMPPPFASH